MIAYLDTSALLRLVLGEPGALKELLSAEALVSSELLAVESWRTIDRLRLQGNLTPEEERALTQILTETRMRFVEVMKGPGGSESA